jgi:hypothetical protein
MLTSLFLTIGGFVLAGGGVWIAALFVPSAALLLKAALDFLKSPLGLVVAITVAGFVLFSSAWVSGDIHGVRATHAAWRKSDALKEAAAKRLIEQNREAAAADAEQRIAELAATAQSLAEKVARYESENKASHVCRLTGDDIRRLRDIR